MPGKVGSLGEFLRDQRRAAELSLRQLAEQTGLSNPYLSQIENGLRRPSAEVLQRLAAALRVSAEVLYVRAGLIEPSDDDRTVETAIAVDLAISERQKRVLLDIYGSFRREHAETLAAATEQPPPVGAEPAPDHAPHDDDTATGGPSVPTPGPSTSHPSTT